MTRQDDLRTIQQSRLFDADWYASEYPDVGRSGLEPAAHYLWLGHRLNRRCSPHFDPVAYLTANQDVAAAGVNPLIHYERSGRVERRRLAPVAAEFLHPEDRVACPRIFTHRQNEWDSTREVAFLATLRGATRFPSARASIIMPSRDRAHCIQAAIASVQGQTYQNWELIVVDDHSDDDTAARVAAIAHEDRRVRYLHNNGERGVSAARNVGLDAAAGDWLFFLDTDNTWRPHFIETMLRFVAHRNLAAAYSAVNLRDDANQSIGTLFAEFERSSLLRENYIDINSFCLRRVTSKHRFDPSLRRLVDWDYILAASAETCIVAAPFVGVDYHDGLAHSRITKTAYSDPRELDAAAETVRSNDRARSIARPGAGPRILSQPRLAVALHLYYPNLVEQLLRYIGNIRQPFDLYVSAAPSFSPTALTLLTERYPDAIVLRYPNIGRDLGPLMEMSSTLAHYDVVCKLHTKRDVGRGNGIWREYNLECMLGTPAIVEATLAAFASDPNILASGSAAFYKSGSTHTGHETMQHVIRLAEQSGLQDCVRRPWGFFAGSMFWARPKLLQRLASSLAGEASYGANIGNDGAPEHGIERMLGMALLTQSNACVALTSVADDGSIVLTRGPADRLHQKEQLAATVARLSAQNWRPRH